MTAALPLIDISPYLPQTQASSSSGTSRAATAQALHEACRDTGFFYLRLPESFASAQEMKDLLDLGREFFHLPQEEKDAIRLENSDGIRGYQRLHQNVTLGKADHHEGIDFYAPSPYPTQPGGAVESLVTKSNKSDSKSELRPLEGVNQFPTNPPTIEGKLKDWIEKMKVLGMAVMRAMCDGLGLDEQEWEEMRGMVDDSFWVMRVIGYPPLPEGMDGISCGEHKDYGCLTFLLADPTPNALQVLSTTSTWLPADPIPQHIVVNIGSMWEIWSGGLYPATLHRVIHKSPTYRVSIPFFFEPNFNARIRTLTAAKRLMKEPTGEEEVIYGEFLLGKVSGNFKY